MRGDPATVGTGRVRLEAQTNTASINLSFSFSQNPLSTGVPVVAIPTGLPGLRITSVGGVAVPATPAGSLAAPDVTLPVE